MWTIRWHSSLAPSSVVQDTPKGARKFHFVTISTDSTTIEQAPEGKLECVLIMMLAYTRLLSVGNAHREHCWGVFTAFRARNCPRAAVLGDT
jgi:hypothetical protein